MSKMELIVLALFMLTSIIFLIKNQITYRNHRIIGNAIYLYKIDMLHQHKPSDDVGFFDGEDYDKTLFRLWDWGYTRILPPDKYEIVKPYIDQAKIRYKEEG